MRRRSLRWKRTYCCRRTRRGESCVNSKRVSAKSEWPVATICTSSCSSFNAAGTCCSCGQATLGRDSLGALFRFRGIERACQTNRHAPSSETLCLRYVCHMCTGVFWGLWACVNVSVSVPAHTRLVSIIPFGQLFLADNNPQN
jgi:hypothetical protein